MFLHHLVSIFLITFSYVNNMARVGTLVLCLHDSADALLEVKVFFIFKSTKSRIQKVLNNHHFYIILDDAGDDSI